MATFTMSLRSVNGIHGRIPCGMPVTASDEFRELFTHFTLDIEGKNRGQEGRNPVTTGHDHDFSYLLVSGRSIKVFKHRTNSLQSRLT